MEFKKIFDDLESNQTQECEEAKRLLVEKFQKYKDQWLANHMLDYYLKTGSQRILEVLVKVQQPHDDHIFGRLSEWIKAQTHRVQALQLFLFIVRRHPTWLFKVDKKNLIKDIFKLLLTEKEIVPLMCALLCIITLLPIMPSLVPNFRDDLFNIFGRLASWKCQNPNGLPDDKLVHLQFGLQILFHRLYGMFPWNFLAYLSDFIKRDKGAIFHHTIKPLLETVRIHPLLVTASIDSETNPSRWKEMEPHDVVVECAKLSLPVMHEEFNADHTQHLSELLRTPGGPRSTPTFYSIEGGTSSSSSSGGPYLEVKHSRSVGSFYSQQQIRELQKTRGAVARFDNSNQSSGVWSPYSEITSSGSIPLTPTPSYILPQTPSLGSQMLEISGSSPPEAAVEATPETTPLKDLKDFRHSSLSAGPPLAAPHAVRAIFATSQPTSPMRKDISQFSFPDMLTSPNENRPASCRELIRSTSSHDRQLMQTLLDRSHSQSPFQTIEVLSAKYGYNSPYDASPKCDTPDMDSELTHMSDLPSNTTQNLTPLPNIPTPTPTPTHIEPLITKTCDDCNETERSLCSAGGLQMPTSRSMQMLAKGLKRRNRMASYCYNEASCAKICEIEKEDKSDSIIDIAKIRRTKSCSSIYTESSRMNKTDDEGTDTDSNGYITPKITGNRLQKSNKMLTIPLVVTKQATKYSNAATQTLDSLPQDYEQYLYELLFENKKIRSEHERNLLYPQEILDQYIKHCNESLEGFHRNENASQDQILQLKEQYQLVCLQLEYERYRREIHAERNRRLMGRSRDKRSLEMERDRLREQLNNFATKNKELINEIDKTQKISNEKEQIYLKEINTIKAKYQYEIDQNKCLRQANELLQSKLSAEITCRKTINSEFDALRGEIFNLTSELQHAENQVEIGLHCKQELARLEAEFIIMGEVQVKCHEYMNDLSNHRALEEELQLLQENYNIELKEQKRILQDKSHQLESAKHKVLELQNQLSNNEKVITEQKRLLKTVKDEYEEKYKILNKKYDVQKIILQQMEEKLMMASQDAQKYSTYLLGSSPDAEKTDLGSSTDHNSPLSTSQASSESLSISLRTNELKNLQQFVQIPIVEASDTGIKATSINFSEGARIPNLDLASSANTATGSSLMANVKKSEPSSSSLRTSSSSTVEFPNYEHLQQQFSQTHNPIHHHQNPQKHHQQLKRL